MLLRVTGEGERVSSCGWERTVGKAGGQVEGERVSSSCERESKGGQWARQVG